MKRLANLSVSLVLALSVALLGIAASTAQEAPPERRVWKDRTGRFRVEASIDSVTATVVRLRRADNDKVIEVPLSSLSEADIAYLRKVAPDAFIEDKERITTAAALEAAAKKRRFALGIIVMYRTFLDDPDVSAEQKKLAEANLARWSPLGASAKIRSGTTWYTPAEYADLEKDELALLARADQELLTGDARQVTKTLLEASKLNPGSIRANFRLGVLSALHPRGLSSKDAEQQFSECVRRLHGYSGDWTDVDMRNLAACYNNLALVSVRQRKLTEALGFWEKCLELGSPPSEALHNFGHLRSLVTSSAVPRSSGRNSVYLSPAERQRFDRLTAKVTATKQSYDPGRGWRYMRLAKSAEKPSGSPDVVAPMGPLSPSLIQVGTGTGFVIGKNHVATNRHVAEAGVAFKLRFESDSVEAARVGTVEILSSDPKIDLAALRCADLPASSLAFSGTSPKLSEELRVLGFPMGDVFGANIKVSRGIVSSLPPQRGIPDPSLERAMFHDAATDGGSSGGPICNQHGAIIGVHFGAMRGRDGNPYKLCVTAEDAISLFRPRVPDLTVFTTMDPSRLAWEEAVEMVRRSTVQVIVMAEPDRFDPIDKDLGKTVWDAYDDPWCMACYGRRSLECPVRGCSRGTVGSYEDKYIPNPTGAGGRTQRTPIRLKCKTCDGRGRVPCRFCELGFDPQFVTRANRSWIDRYVALLSGLGSAD